MSEPLAYQLAGETDADRWIAITHGIFGRGSNWRSFARQLGRRIGWGAVLIDLRMHGESRDRPGPHTVDAAAADVVELVASLRDRGVVIAALLGHSFGGKVIACARPSLDELESLWLVDSSPSARPEAMKTSAAYRVLELLEATVAGQRFESREAFVAALAGRGLAAPVARWLALNLDRDDGGFVFALDLAAIRALLVDYFNRDAWAEIAAGPPVVDVALAGRESALDADDRRRLEALEGEGAVRLHRFEEPGHWIHVDAAEALVEAVASGLGAGG